MNWLKELFKSPLEKKQEEMYLEVENQRRHDEWKKNKLSDLLTPRPITGNRWFDQTLLPMKQNEAQRELNRMELEELDHIL